MCKEGKCECKQKEWMLTQSWDAMAHGDCPVCGAVDDYTVWDDGTGDGEGETGDAFLLDGFLLHAKSECLVCGSQWTDTYKFMGKREVTERGEIMEGKHGGLQSFPTD